jgi:ABC-type sugar transport system substrate-binding protein
MLVALLDVSQEFQRYQAIDAQRIGAELGVAVEVAFAGNSAAAQESQLVDVVARTAAERPAVVFVQTVSGDGLELVARAVARSGSGWVLINRRAAYMQDLREEYPDLPIASVSADQVEIGRIQGRQLLALLGRADARVLYLTGPRDTSAAQDRLEGTRSVLGEAAVDLRLIEGDWTEASGHRAVTGWLRARGSLWTGWKRNAECLPDAVVCQNDHMALGARRALVDAAPRVVPPVLGVDGLADGGQRLVDLGELAATVIVPPNVGPALHLAARMLRTGERMPAQLLLSAMSYPRRLTAPPDAPPRRSAAG